MFGYEPFGQTPFQIAQLRYSKDHASQNAGNTLLQQEKPQAISHQQTKENQPPGLVLKTVSIAPFQISPMLKAKL